MNPVQLTEIVRCGCGCGEPAPIGTRTDRSRGYIRGKPRRFIHGHNARIRPPRITGARNSRWKGDAAGIRAVHDWLEKHFGSEKIACEECGETEKLNWAYKGPNGGFERRREAYRVLCPRCHKRFDEGKES